MESQLFQHHRRVFVGDSFADANAHHLLELRIRRRRRQVVAFAGIVFHDLYQARADLIRFLIWQRDGIVPRAAHERREIVQNVLVSGQLHKHHRQGSDIAFFQRVHEMRFVRDDRDEIEGHRVFL